MTSTTAAPSTPTAQGLLAQRVAVVTGASSGIGAATARAVIAHGGSVALVARRPDRLEALATELAAGERLLTRAGDVADPTTIDALAADVRARLGRADLVVANAGVMLPGAVDAQPFAEWRAQLDVNVIGVLATVRAFVPALLEAAAAGGRADLVLVSSIAAHQVFPEYAVYGATKAAVTALGAGLRAELAPRGVRVTVVEPGFTATELQGNVTHAGHREQLEGWFGGLETLRAEDVAELIAHAAGLPARVNLPHLVVVPTAQP